MSPLSLAAAVLTLAAPAFAADPSWWPAWKTENLDAADRVFAHCKGTPMEKDAAAKLAALHLSIKKLVDGVDQALDYQKKNLAQSLASGKTPQAEADAERRRMDAAADAQYAYIYGSIYRAALLAGFGGHMTAEDKKKMAPAFTHAEYTAALKKDPVRGAWGATPNNSISAARFHP